MKNTYYFPHDFNARNDPKLINLAMKGWDLVGLYWAMVEMLHEQGGWLDIDPIPIGFALRTPSERIAVLINFPELFKIVDNQFTCPRILSNLKYRKERSDKARKSAKVLWDKKVTTPANAERTHSVGNAKKGKERKGKEITIGASPDVVVVRDFFYSMYEKTSGDKYPPAWGKDGKIFKDLLATFPVEKIKILIEDFFESKDEFILNAGYSVGVFKGVIPKLQSSKGARLTRMERDMTHA